MIISSCRFSSIEAPKIIFASSSTSWWIISTALLISRIPTSFPPITLTSTPPAPLMLVSSNGLEIAFLAASSALFSPVALLTPKCATPESVIIVLISAKSKLTRPTFVTRSAILWTPSLKTSSDILKASSTWLFLSILSNNLSFEVTIIESTQAFNSSIPFSACCIRLLPSNENGLDTTAIVNIPISFATSATIGAAPVPVPPPIPAVMNTISAPRRASLISNLVSSALILPICGSAPEPKPLVKFLPICILVWAFDWLIAFKSVFIATNSTFSTPSLIMLLTALFPAPPIPITLIFTMLFFASNSSISSLLL